MQAFSDTPLLQGEELLELIPQRSPIVMVDTFFGVDEAGSYTGLEVGRNPLFCRNGFLDECGVTEHIAQSAAVRLGYLCRLAGTDVPVGFIGSVNKMTYHALPAVGEELFTRITVEEEIFDITLISAQVKAGDRLIAEGQMKIYSKKEA